MPEVHAGHNHPGTLSPTVVYLRALGGPLAFCLLPVVLITTAAALMGYDVLSWFGVGTMIGYVVAHNWTNYRLKSRPAEVHIDNDVVAVRSVWEVAHRAPAGISGRLMELQREAGATHIGLADTHVELTDDDWPNPDELLGDLMGARQAARVLQEVGA